ncbi:MAG: CDP-alcohol phosphatidyltransferase family protein [Saprospiraceae bacterium]|nr:CDP-alcohol phosphatidyltransferase family protein [Saprospiraceae bacterium]MDW8483631.1 CDP-alcohol phosphatidyltransferase family protein [Saprospiraceae bacterium]
MKWLEFLCQRLPNALTLGNLFCGCCAVVLWLDNQPYPAAACTIASFILDYADGLLARALKVSSSIGRELDSLADGVSFGVVPGLMLYCLLANALCMQEPAPTAISTAARLWCWEATPAFTLSLCAAYRLGRFNLDVNPRSYFLGLSTPACTVWVLGLALAASNNTFGLGDFVRRNPWTIYGLTVLLSYLMVSRIPMHGLKVEGSLRVGWQRLLAFVVTGGLLCWGLGPLGLTVAATLYILYSIAFPPA